MVYGNEGAAIRSFIASHVMLLLDDDLLELADAPVYDFVEKRIQVAVLFLITDKNGKRSTSLKRLVQFAHANTKLSQEDVIGGRIAQIVLVSAIFDNVPIGRMEKDEIKRPCYLVIHQVNTIFLIHPGVLELALPANVAGRA